MSCGARHAAAEDGFTLSVLGDSGVRTTVRAESLTPGALRNAIDELDPWVVLSISTPETILSDLRGGRTDPYWFERVWLGAIGRLDLLPTVAVEEINAILAEAGEPATCAEELERGPWAKGGIRNGNT